MSGKEANFSTYLENVLKTPRREMMKQVMKSASVWGVGKAQFVRMIAADVYMAKISNSRCRLLHFSDTSDRDWLTDWLFSWLRSSSVWSAWSPHQVVTCHSSVQTQAQMQSLSMAILEALSWQVSSNEDEMSSEWANFNWCIHRTKLHCREWPHFPFCFFFFPLAMHASGCVHPIC